ncbi:MAG: A24 family peptidase [Planctomycetota bacterium]
MDWLLDTPLALRLAVVFVVAAGLASLLNAAIYHWAWDRRLFSPWQPRADGASPRSWRDWVPILGWLRLRRDSKLHGRGFWVRPLLIEIGFAAAVAALYWWEVERLALIAPQVARLAGTMPLDPAPLAWATHTQFLAHTMLGALMTVATFIDFDERLIPDEVTRRGTLAGLVLVAITPLALPPVVTDQPVAPELGIAVIDTAGNAVANANGALSVIPTHLAAPTPWPASLDATPTSLAIGLGCFWLWCFALTDRHWPHAGAFGRKLKLVARRIVRDLTTSPLRESLAGGTALVLGVWWFGGPRWMGLLSSLVGLAACGLLVWAVRIIGGAVMRREAMGFGDVTLMMMVGVYTGWQAGPIIFFLAPLAGIFLGVLNLLVHGDKAIPYGPFLCLATVFVLLIWAPLWMWAEPLLAFPALVPTVLVVCFALLAVLLAMLQGLKALLGISGED